jgi:Zn finger protein HypA/HybF involved in hydrogenase expression
MQPQIESAVRVFEEVEKIRRGCDIKLTHLARNRKCLSCSKDFMPKAYEPCPKCGSQNTKLMRQRRRCVDCGHRWQPSALGVCPWCGSPDSEENPRDDPYIRQIALPRLKGDEDFFEDQLKKMVESHPAWGWASQVKGAGLTTIGRIIGKTDIHRVNTASEMWAHCGFGLEADGTRQRKRAGAKINYDPQLQSNCVMLGESLMFQKDSYYSYYLREKEKHSQLPPRHAHNRAFRHMIKLFLSHLWQTWREAEGLPAPAPYAFAILRHPEGHLITPWDMIKKPAEIRQQSKVGEPVNKR